MDIYTKIFLVSSALLVFVIFGRKYVFDVPETLMLLLGGYVLLSLISVSVRSIYAILCCG